MIDIMGIGEGGWDSLGIAEQRKITQAETIIGGRRHLGLIPAVGGQRRRTWPSPLREKLPAFLDELDATHKAPGMLVALASGDPLLSGVGTTIIDILGIEHVRITPAVSSETWARARMGWSWDTVTVVTLVGRPLDDLPRHLHQGARLVVLCSDGSTPHQIAQAVAGAGYPTASLTAWWHLGGPLEGSKAATAADFDQEPTPDLVLVCVDLT